MQQDLVQEASAHLQQPDGRAAISLLGQYVIYFLLVDYHNYRLCLLDRNYSNLIEQISRIIGLTRDEFILLTKTKRLEPLSSVQGDCLQTIPNKGHLKYELTDDTVMVMVTKPMEFKPTDLVSRELTGMWAWYVIGWEIWLVDVIDRQLREPHGQI